MTQALKTAWRLAHSEIRLHSFAPESSVLFHCASGDTHMLDLFGSTIITVLEKGLVTESVMYSKVAGILNYELDDSGLLET